MTYTLDELKAKISAEIDPDLFVEILDISTDKLVASFEDMVIEYRFKFIEYFDTEVDVD